MRLLSAVIATLFFSIPSVALIDSDDGVVIGVVGKWTVVGKNQPISFGMRVNPNMSIQRVAGQPREAISGSLTILLGDVRVTFACDDPHTLPDHSTAGCIRPILLASAARPHEQESGWLGRISSLISRDPPRYYEALSRDLPSVADAVIPNLGSSTNFASVFSSMSIGEYRVTPHLLKPDKPPADLPNMLFTLNWDPEKPASAAAPDLPIGLYQIHVEVHDTAGGEWLPVGDAWVLVVGPREFAARAASFEDVTKLTAGWGSEVPVASVRALDRAALDLLSR
jgi:hypothetical protein